jgi:hypothetical protein
VSSIYIQPRIDTPSVRDPSAQKAMDLLGLVSRVIGVIVPFYAQPSVTSKLEKLSQILPIQLTSFAESHQLQIRRILHSFRKVKDLLTNWFEIQP